MWMTARFRERLFRGKALPHSARSRVNSFRRVILDASARRFQAHKIYLKASAATRWVQARVQILRGEKPNGRHQGALRTIDQRLREVRYRNYGSRYRPTRPRGEAKYRSPYGSDLRGVVLYF